MWFYTALLFLVLVRLRKGSENVKGANKLQGEITNFSAVFCLNVTLYLTG